MKLNLLNAVIATLVLLVMASFLMGMQLSLEGTPAGSAWRGGSPLDVDWHWLRGGVFLPNCCGH
ncbi:Uncharacterised protein [Serratia odorifera]|uniref:High-affinity branched-chain amino acid transport system permease LivHM N-terminal domain-containing protein n=1 Tax=Serratia odorifera TaxID=618 RepID=A0A3S4ET13_SEROD|nr:Uncharacterised protein [Serratia odorifera]